VNLHFFKIDYELLIMQ